VRAEHCETAGKAFATEHFGRRELGCTVADDHDAVRMLHRRLPGAFATASLDLPARHGIALLSLLQSVC
jgi:hypothetical protein